MERRLTRRKFLGRLGAGGAALGIAPGLLGEASGGSSRKIGIALCGLGNYSTGQLGPALRQTRHCYLAGVITGDAAKGRRWARNYDFPESSVYHYDTMERLADNPEIDVVYSVTPPGLHMRDTLRGLAAGKHVISEKPMAISVEQCDRMIAAAKAAGKQLSMGYRCHFHPYHEEVKRLGHEGDWGPFETMSGGFGYRLSVPSWRQTQALGGGGQLMNVGIYVIQSACMAKGGEVPVAVRAEEPPKKRPNFFKEVEETLYFTLEFADGTTCRGETSGELYSNRFRAEAPRGWLELNPAFSYGGLQMRTHEGEVQALRGFNQQAAQMDAFALSLLEGRPDIVPGKMGRRDMQVIEAIYRAAKSGKREAV